MMKNRELYHDLYGYIGRIAYLMETVLKEVMEGKEEKVSIHFENIKGCMLELDEEYIKPLHLLEFEPPQEEEKDYNYLMEIYKTYKDIGFDRYIGLENADKKAPLKGILNVSDFEKGLLYYGNIASYSVEQMKRLEA